VDEKLKKMLDGIIPKENRRFNAGAPSYAEFLEAIQQSNAAFALLKSALEAYMAMLRFDPSGAEDLRQTIHDKLDNCLDAQAKVSVKLRNL
jgi:hypothetical protein